MNENDTDGWFEGDEAVATDASLKDYQISALPNDFNVKTIVDFVDSKVVKIPGFQRNYVWDRHRASRLIESLLMGLPIPQVFLYEEHRNSFLVIDGQQRLMSIYYFVNGRFPRKEKRIELRRIFAQEGNMPSEVFHNDKYFEKFNLDLEVDNKQTSRFHGQNYETLGDYKTTLDLTVIRNIIIKQNAPEEDRDSSIFEIFNRLNTGGVNLTAQEIRASIYQSEFMTMIDRMTLNPTWRRIVGRSEPDIHLKESEVFYRCFAMLANGSAYREPMGTFINEFARRAKAFKADEVAFAESIFNSFFESIRELPRSAFSVTDRVRINISLLEAAFRVLCETGFASKSPLVVQTTEAKFSQLRHDEEFVNASRFATGQASNVKKRFDRAKAILL